MQNGLYKVVFQTMIGAGAGVVYLRDGQLRGGDSMSFYRGTYSVSGSNFAASVDVATHTKQPGMTLVMGANGGTLTLKGATNGDAAKASGTTPQAPGITFQCLLERVSD